MDDLSKCGKIKRWHMRHSWVCQGCSYHILMSSMIYHWTDTHQYGIYLFYITKEGKILSMMKSSMHLSSHGLWLRTIQDGCIILHNYYVTTVMSLPFPHLSLHHTRVYKSRCMCHVLRELAWIEFREFSFLSSDMLCTFSSLQFFFPLVFIPLHKKHLSKF